MKTTVFRLVALVLIWGAVATTSFVLIGNTSLHWLQETTMLAALAIVMTGGVAATFAVLRYQMA